MARGGSDPLGAGVRGHGRRLLSGAVAALCLLAVTAEAQDSAAVEWSGGADAPAEPWRAQQEPKRSLQDQSMA